MTSYQGKIMETLKQNELKELITQPIKKDWLNPKEVNLEFGLSVSSLAKFRMERKYLKFSKVGKYIKYKREDIEAFLESNIINVEVA